MMLSTIMAVVVQAMGLVALWVLGAVAWNVIWGSLSE
jgi:hypothetical protein